MAEHDAEEAEMRRQNWSEHAVCRSTIAALREQLAATQDERDHVIARATEAQGWANHWQMRWMGAVATIHGLQGHEGRPNECRASALCMDLGLRAADRPDLYYGMPVEAAGEGE
jgi:hypothetical protein